MKRKVLSLLVAFVLCMGLAIPALAANESLAATPTASTVLVNGENVAFDAYNISGNNYFKLRDLAYILSGTEKQFDVGWDGTNNAIALTSGKAYTEVGGEMTGKGAGNKTPTATSSKIFMDGKEVQFTAYNIEGNNYFKLRDIGETFDFGVTWDGTKNTIVIDTSIVYTPESPPVTGGNAGKTFTCTGEGNFDTGRIEEVSATVEVISSHEAVFTMEFPFAPADMTMFDVWFSKTNVGYVSIQYWPDDNSIGGFWSNHGYGGETFVDLNAESFSDINAQHGKITWRVKLPVDFAFNFDMIGEYVLHCDASVMGG